ncbi:MAG: acyl-CoA dehydrogenase family protein [Alphaproteobacteria bacterium]|jgi:alkylation response protein AidB-like acyl-CoA dehydrogenase|nr:acyl-CoA dehydrogenase family protein [Alphaproteobacteria bacterium]MDP6811970.1 acyl-CoA dehydrogenase family protein [Alphaproteobacteria bacterium]
MNAPDLTAAAASAIAPDTAGWNFYATDQSLQDLLRLYLAPDLFEHLQPHLHRLGGMVANELDQAARLANHHTPILHQRDRYGRDEQWIEYHPSYRQLEAAAFGTFGIHAMSHRKGILNWPQTYPAVAKHAFTYLFNQAEFGLGCPINVTDSGAHVLRLYGDQALQDKFLERMTTTDVDQLWQSGQYITEKEGGSDVGSLISTARWDGSHWRISGEKWFCSNADAEVVMLLARPEGAGMGTRGLGLFLMPRHLDDGSPNSYRFVRLKEKLGTRSMASAEVVMEDAVAYQVGELDRGFKQMAEMVNWSRLSNGVKSTALMRRAAHDAMAVLAGRQAFGVALMEKPLARRQMLKILLPTEQALSFVCFTAEALDRAEGTAEAPPSQEAAAILRLATPVLKFRATRDGRAVAGDSLDMRSGCGYIEEWINPRLVRDAHCGSVWEGAGNIVALDALGRAVARHGCHEPFAAALQARLDEADGAPAAFIDQLRRHIDRAGEFALHIASRQQDEASARQATSNLYHAASAALMAWEGARIHAERGDARRLLWARLVLDHRLAARDPYEAVDGGWEDTVSRCLLDPAPIPMAVVGELLSG